MWMKTKANNDFNFYLFLSTLVAADSLEVYLVVMSWVFLKCLFLFHVFPGTSLLQRKVCVLEC